MKDEFYIGWMPEAPEGFAKHIKKAVLVLVVVVITAAVVLGLFQKRFSTAAFEFGVLTELKGVYHSNPVPLLRVMSRKDVFGHASFVTIPLVGYGKNGAGGTMKTLGEEKGQDLEGKLLTLKGTLLYNDGKILMQVDRSDDPLVTVSEKDFLSPATKGEGEKVYLPAAKDLGMQTLSGEIVDPKCYFGVMKPGQGKPHKDCAIRCILGGIPPVLRVTNAEGASHYYLLAGAEGEPMNEKVKDVVAEPVSITAKAVQYDDWIVLYTSKERISRISYARLLNPEATLASCSVDCRE